MAQSPVFDALVSSLSSAERQEMLDRIRRSIVLDDEPVERELGPAETDTEYAYATMSVWQKLLIVLRMIIGAVSREEAVGRHLMRGLTRSLQTQAAHLVDTGAAQLLPDFRSELEQLSSACGFFGGPVARARRGGLDAFYAFVLGLEMPETRDDLLVSSDPFRLGERIDENDEHVLRREAESRVASLLNGIPAWVRTTMETNAAFFESLSELTAFDFDGLLSCFDVERCEVDHARAGLERLGLLLKGLAAAPGAGLLEGLVLFDAGLAGRGIDSEELEALVNDRVGALQTRLDTIRGFARRVPLFDIIRYASGDPAYHLPAPAGGRQWRGLIERFWSKRMDGLFRIYAFERKKEELLAQAAEIAGVPEIEPLADYPVAEGSRNGTHAASLAILSALIERLRAKDFSGALKTLFVQGSFYKEENRAEYNEHYGAIGDLATALDSFSFRVSQNGDLAAAVAEAVRGESDPGPALERVDDVADHLVRRGVETTHGLAEILRGVLYGEVGGRYDTLSNLDEVDGRNNHGFRERLDETLVFLKSGGPVLSSMYDVEKSSARRRAALRRTEP